MEPCAARKRYRFQGPVFVMKGTTSKINNGRFRPPPPESKVEEQISGPLVVSRKRYHSCQGCVVGARLNLSTLDSGGGGHRISHIQMVPFITKTGIKNQIQNMHEIICMQGPF